MADTAILSSFIGGTDISSLGILSPAFEVVRRMADTHKRVKLGQKRCKLIFKRALAALVIKDVHGNLQTRQISIPDVTKLQQLFEEVQVILQKLAEMSFFKALLHFDVVNNSVEQANRYLTDCLQLFQIELLLHVQAQVIAAKSDRDALLALCNNLAGNYEEVRRHFEIHNNDQESQVMAVMERELRNAKVAPEEDMPVELQIIQRSLECIKTTTGRSAPKQNSWLITEYDLDYCGTIGGGGFSTVSKARFRGMMVAVKTLKSAGNMKEALEREIDIWSQLRHDHIVPFYGASTLTSPPYIVSRYMRNGNLVQYLAVTPDADRTRLICGVSLGMYDLHEKHIVHGDLKGVNVLVDDAGKACITDFGLSKICSSGTSGTQPGKITGTLRYLAPEALSGQPLSFETDVYAFGMLIYEVFTGEVPFIRVPDEFVEEGLAELHRPTSSKVYERGLNDVLWQLLSDCISRKASSRPRFKMIQAQLHSLSKAEQSGQSVRPDPTPNPDQTDWGVDTHSAATLISRAAPLANSDRSISRELSSRRFVPVRIQVTHKYFGVKFGISSGEPGVYLEDTDSFRWQSIGATKGSLMSEEGNGFSYRSSVSKGNNSWELNGTDVTLCTLTVPTGVCHFSDSQMAQKWYRLQLNYARDGFVGNWVTVMGDWFHTEQSWRRLVRGKFQQAHPVAGVSDTVPTDSSWKDVNLPKRCIIDNYASSEKYLVCITKPGKQSGRFCCKLDGRKVIFETYRQQSDRQQGDKGLLTAREEIYPSEEYAEATFYVVKKVLEKAAGLGDNTLTKIFSF